MSKEISQEKIFTEQDVLDYIQYVELHNIRYAFKAPLSPTRWFNEVKGK